jgi:hypothetical protein
MSDSITVDTARLPLLLGELRLPTVGKLWQAFTERADREGEAGQGSACEAGGMPDEGGPPRGCWQPSPNSNWPNALSDASSDICWRRACRRARRSTVSTSPAFPWSAMPMSPRSPVAMPG